MATNHTTNYALNLWEPQDSFLRTEFNENSQKIDAAIKAEVTKLNTALVAKADTATVNTALAAKADTAAVNTALAKKADADAMTTALAAKGNCRIVTGSYSGKGTYGQSNPNTLNFAGYGKAPALIVVGSGGSYWFVAVRNMSNFYLATGGSTIYEIKLEWTSTALNWYSTHSPDVQLNKSGTTYRYCALFD